MITEALRSLRPTASFTVVGETYEGITWLDAATKMPSRLEVEEEVARLKTQRELNAYKEKRRLEYPPMSDYLDAVYWQSQGDDSKMIEYWAKIEAVKEKYPKPEGI